MIDKKCHCVFKINVDYEIFANVLRLANCLQ